MNISRLVMEHARNNNSSCLAVANSQRMQWRFLLLALLMLASGSTYSFSAYAEPLKRAFELSQSQLSFISSALIFTYWFTFPSAYIYYHYGARVSCATGAICTGIGHVVIAGQLQGWLPDGWILTLAAFVVLGQGSTFMYTTGLNMSMEISPTANMGWVIGFYNALNTLSATVYSGVFDLMPVSLPGSTPHNLAWYFLFLAIASTSVNLLCSVFLYPVVECHYYQSLEQLSPPKQGTSILNARFVLLLCSFVLVESPVLSFLGEYGSYLASNGVLNQRVVGKLNIVSMVSGTIAGVSIGPIITLFSRKFGPGAYPYLQLNTLITASMYILLWVTPLSTMWLTSALLGITNTCFATLYPILITSSFPLQEFSRIYGIVCSVCALCNIGFQRLASMIYEHNLVPGTNSCTGKPCFDLTLIIHFILCIVGFIINAALIHLVYQHKKSKRQSILSSPMGSPLIHAPFQ